MLQAYVGLCRYMWRDVSNPQNGRCKSQNRDTAAIHAALSSSSAQAQTWEKRRGVRVAVEC